MCLEEPHAQKFLILVTGGLFLFTVTYCPPHTLHSDFEVHQEKNLGVFCGGERLEEDLIWAAPGTQSYMVHMDEEQAKLCK